MLPVALKALCCTASMCRHSRVLAVHSWHCAVAELCGHRKAWNESGLVSPPSGQCLTASLLGLCTAAPREQSGPCLSLQSHLLPTRKKWEGAVCLLAEVQVGQSPSSLGVGVQGRWSDYSTCHQPSCTRALLAASYEGHVCAAGLATCRLFPARWEGSMGKASCTGQRQEGPELRDSVPWQDPPAVPTFGMPRLWVALFSSLKRLDVHGGVASANSDDSVAAASPQESKWVPGHLSLVCLEGLQGSSLD